MIIWLVEYTRDKEKIDFISKHFRMTKKILKKKEEIKDLHGKFWNWIWWLAIKYSSVIFLVLFGFVEFTRKFKLYDAWVPLFVLDSEPLITNYTYGKTIVLAIAYVPSLYLFVIWIEHVMLYSECWKKILSFLLVLIGGGIMVFALSGLLQYSPPSWENLYLSKDYKVVRSGTGIVVTIGDEKYSCRKPMVFTDECSLIEAGK